jgi:hypothetical protein
MQGLEPYGGDAGEKRDVELCSLSRSKAARKFSASSLSTPILKFNIRVTSPPFISSCYLLNKICKFATNSVRRIENE